MVLIFLLYLHVVLDYYSKVQIKWPAGSFKFGKLVVVLAINL